MMRYILLVLMFAGFALNAQQKKISYTLFFIGDCGELNIGTDPIGKVLHEKVAAAGVNTSVVYLGDNVYPRGLRDEGERLRKEGEIILQDQVNIIDATEAKGIFIPGNHDWQHWGRRGQEYINNQQRWIDSLKDDRITLLPRDACPGPVEIPLDSANVLVILDTQWFLHQWDKPGEDSPCEAKTTAEALGILNDIFERNPRKRIIIAAHHPLITYGEHGGEFTWKSHLFPLADLTKYFYLPLPGVGSIYPLYRKWFGHIQDTKHPVYRQFGDAIQNMMKKYPGSIYVAGHEHALEYIVKDSSHFIVSGSGSKTEFVRQKDFAAYAQDVRGFVQMTFYDDGTVENQFYQVDNLEPNGKLVFTKSLTSITTHRKIIQSDSIDFPARVSVRASNQYRASESKKKWLGENYRAEWEQEIEVDVFDIGKEKGGLKILQRGGGQQTLSLRLEDSTGHEYVLRSVEKYPESAVPEILRKTFAQDLVQDQISASHPYAALVVPDLAKAAGIYYTNPKLVYIPDDPRFGIYQKTFGNTLALFEERPAGNWKEADYFGNSTKIINTAKVIEKLAEDNDNSIDQEFVLRSRLLDMIIGDWDRHDDQWRWATFKTKKGDTYRPIPRDRDQAFFVNEGRLGKLWSRRWALPKFEGFDEDINWPSGLAFNARYFDRSFLTELTSEQWLNQARDLKKSLSDEEIESAIRRWPQEIYNKHGEQIVKAIEARRNNIDQYALSHYRFLAREVDVTGSNKRERFEVTRLPNYDTRLRVFKLNKDGEVGKEFYERVFHHGETKEVRLYGLGGNDEFVIHGNSKRGSKIRMIGGAGEDVVIDSARNNKLHAKTIFYDEKAHGKIASGSAVADKRSDDPQVNQYDRKAFQYDKLVPLISGNFNPDDGVFIGGGFAYFKHGFRKKPFKQRHIFLATVAPLTFSFNFQYQGVFTEAFGKWNLGLDANLRSPNFVNNFFGWGNESVFNKDIDEEPGIQAKSAIRYYRYRFEELTFNPTLSRKLGNSLSFKVGPLFQRIEMEKPEKDKDRYIETYANSLAYNLFDEYNTYVGAAWEVGVDKRDSPTLTTRGLRLNMSGRHMTRIESGLGDFSSYESSLSFYHSARLPAKIVFALRFGGGINTGTYEFYQAQILDGKTELRGFRKTRFYGDSKLYSNFETRLKLLSFKSYLFPASMGILGFVDTGRIWYKDANGKDPSVATGKSTLWHYGYGGGVWFTPFNLTVLSAEVGHSKEGPLAYVRLGFLF